MTIVDSAVPGSVECSMKVGDAWIGVDVGLLQYEAEWISGGLVGYGIARGSVQQHDAITAHVGFNDVFDLHVSYTLEYNGTRHRRNDDIIGCRLTSVYHDGRAEFSVVRIKRNGIWCF